MNAASVATSGMSGASVALACWVAQARYGVTFPDYVVASLLTLVVGASHGAHYGVSWWLARKPAT